MTMPEFYQLLWNKFVCSSIEENQLRVEEKKEGAWCVLLIGTTKIRKIPGDFNHMYVSYNGSKREKEWKLDWRLSVYHIPELLRNLEGQNYKKFCEELPDNKSVHHMLEVSDMQCEIISFL
jgi:hypothetical protein